VPVHELGTEVKYRFARWDGEPEGLTVSGFAFYNRALFTVGSGPPNPDDVPLRSA